MSRGYSVLNQYIYKAFVRVLACWKKIKGGRVEDLNQKKVRQKAAD